MLITLNDGESLTVQTREGGKAYTIIRRGNWIGLREFVSPKNKN